MPQSHADDWPRRLLTWYEKLHLMSSWTSSSRLQRVAQTYSFLHSRSLIRRKFFLFSFKRWLMFCIFLQMTAVIKMRFVATDYTLLWRSWKTSSRDVGGRLWFWGRDINLRLSVLWPQVSPPVGKRQMADLRSIWAKPHWCQQADWRWRHIRDQHPPENSWPEPEGGADSRLAAASC